MNNVQLLQDQVVHAAHIMHICRWAVAGVAVAVVPWFGYWELRRHYKFSGVSLSIHTDI
jgi:hypothetical protein